MPAPSARTATNKGQGLKAVFAGGYTVVVYVGDGGWPGDHSATFNLTIGGDTLAGAVLPAFDGTFDSLDGSGDGGNVWTSATLTDDELTLTIAATGNATVPTAAINGIQIFSSRDGTKWGLMLTHGTVPTVRIAGATAQCWRAPLIIIINNGYL